MGRYVDAAKFCRFRSWTETTKRFSGVRPGGRNRKIAPAAEELRRTGSIISLPPALKIPLGLQVVEAAIELGDPKMANHYLEILNVESSTPKERMKRGVEGKLAETQGDFEGQTKWEDVADGDDRRARARASVAKVELLMKLRRLDPGEALEELETLRFAWRGDDFEFDLLRRMGDLYLSIGDYRNGLHVRQAATNFREHDEARSDPPNGRSLSGALFGRRGGSAGARHRHCLVR